MGPLPFQAKLMDPLGYPTLLRVRYPLIAVPAAEWRRYLMGPVPYQAKLMGPLGYPTLLRVRYLLFAVPAADI